MPAGPSKAKSASSPVSGALFRRSLRQASVNASRQLSGSTAPAQPDLAQVVKEFKDAVGAQKRSKPALRLAWTRLIDKFRQLHPSDPGPFGRWARDNIGDQYLVDALPQIFDSELAKGQRVHNYVVKATDYLGLDSPVFTVLYLGRLFRSFRTLQLLGVWAQRYPDLQIDVDVYPRLVKARRERLIANRHRRGQVDDDVVFADPRLDKNAGLKPQDVTVAALDCEFSPLVILAPLPRLSSFLSLLLTASLPTDVKEKDPGAMDTFREKLNVVVKASSKHADDSDVEEEAPDADGDSAQDGEASVLVLDSGDDVFPDEDADDEEDQDQDEDEDEDEVRRGTAMADEEVDQSEVIQSTTRATAFARQHRPFDVVREGSLPRLKPERPGSTSPHFHVDTPSHHSGKLMEPSLGPLLAIERDSSVDIDSDHMSRASPSPVANGHQAED